MRREQRQNCRFEGLAHIDDVQQFSVTNDGQCFVDLGRVLQEHGKLSRFLVTLLHTHFLVNDDEYVVQYLDPDERLVLIEVENEANREFSDSFPSSWRLRPGTEPTPLQYTKSRVQIGESTLSPSDLACLEHATRVLAAHKSLDRFGLAIRMLDIDLSDEEYLLETTFLEDRAQELEPKPRTEFNLAASVQTSWRLQAPEQLQALFGCKKKTETWCDRFCETSCKWDDYVHNSKHKGARHSKRSQSVHYG